MSIAIIGAVLALIILPQPGTALASSEAPAEADGQALAAQVPLAKASTANPAIPGPEQPSPAESRSRSAKESVSEPLLLLLFGALLIALSASIRRLARQHLRSQVGGARQT